MAKNFGWRLLPDLFTWKRGSKWTKSSIVEVSAGEKSGLYINAILKSQVTALHLFRKHQKIPRQTSTIELFVHICLIRMQKVLQYKKARMRKGCFSLSVHEKSPVAFPMQAIVGLLLKGWISLLFYPHKPPKNVKCLFYLKRFPSWSPISLPALLLPRNALVAR